MHVLTLKTRTATNIKIPGYPKYTIKLILSNGASGVYEENGYTERANYANIYIYYIIIIYIYIGNLNRESALAQQEY